MNTRPSLFKRIKQALLLALAFAAAALWSPVTAQESTATDTRPTMAVGTLDSDIQLDGRLTEEAWSRAVAIDHLTMIEPVEGGTPTA